MPSKDKSEFDVIISNLKPVCSSVSEFETYAIPHYLINSNKIWSTYYQTLVELIAQVKIFKPLKSIKWGKVFRNSEIIYA